MSKKENNNYFERIRATAKNTNLQNRLNVPKANKKEASEALPPKAPKRRRKPRNKSEDAIKRKSVAVDVLFLFFGLLAIILLLALFSYSENDPGYGKQVISKLPSAEEVNNVVGRTGALLASYLGVAFGWSSLLIPFIFIYIAVLLFRYKQDKTFLLAPVLATIYSIIILASLSIISGIIGGNDPYFTIQPAGGAFGIIGAKIIVNLMGSVGGLIIFICVILAFSMLLFSISFGDLFAGLRALGSIFKKVFGGIAFLFSNKKQIEEKEDEDMESKQNTSSELMPINKPASILDADEMAAISSINFDIDSSKEANRIEEGINEDETKIYSNEIILSQNDYEEVSSKLEMQPLEEETIQEVKVEFISTPPAIEEKAAPTTPIIREEYKQAKAEEEKPIEIAPITLENVEIRQAVHIDRKKYKNYMMPLSLLKDAPFIMQQDSDEDMRKQGELLLAKLRDFSVDGEIKAIQPGPVVTTFEFKPAPGTRVAKIESLENDLALAMSAISVRIIGHIPGKDVVGIEVPNRNRASVYIKELFQTSEFIENKSPLAVALGKDAIGKPYISDITKMPHLLVAGTTGSGKSVGINTMICSILYKSSPDDVKFIMIDPKQVELSVYEDIPHLLAPVVTDPKKASSVLKNIVTEMDRRYSLLKERKVRHITSYNELSETDESIEYLPYLVVVVDEFADLMMVAGKDIEASISRIAQLARAVGIHLIIATQRPTTNVITGLIKANMPSRLAFKVSQRNDSRVILDSNGADTLLGMGDSLFIPPGSSNPVRVHGCFVSDKEVQNIVEYLQSNYGKPEYNMEFVRDVEEAAFDSEMAQDEVSNKDDELYSKALALARTQGSISASKLQRHFNIGFNRAGRIMDMLEERGVIGPSDGSSKPRPVIS